MAAQSISAFPGPSSTAKADTGIAANVVELKRPAMEAKPRSLDVTGGNAVDLGECLKDLAGAVVAALSVNGRVSLRVECEDKCLLPPEAAIPICLLVVELVTNSIKYAHPAGVEGQVRLECRRTPDGVMTVEVSDDGVGLPEGFDPMKARTLGLRLVRTLAARAGARIDFSQDPLGLSFVLTLPAAAPA